MLGKGCGGISEVVAYDHGLWAASAVKHVDTPLFGFGNQHTRRKSWGLLNGRQGKVLQAYSVLTDHILLKNLFNRAKP